MRHQNPLLEWKKQGQECSMLAYLAFLDGDHIRETAHHPGAICKYRHFWLITEILSISDYPDKTTPGN